jgi:excinuclease UvrABC nuclease subunit
MMEDLRAEGFEAFGQPTVGTGVYLLILEGVVIYVGKSLNVYHRIGQHFLAMKRHKKGMRPYRGKEELPLVNFDKVLVKWLPLSQINIEETKLIQRYLPECNTQQKRPDVSSIPAVAKLIRDAVPVAVLTHGLRDGVVRRRAA